MLAEALARISHDILYCFSRMKSLQLLLRQELQSLPGKERQKKSFGGALRRLCSQMAGSLLW